MFSTDLGKFMDTEDAPDILAVGTGLLPEAGRVARIPRRNQHDASRTGFAKLTSGAAAWAEATRQRGRR